MKVNASLDTQDTFLQEIRMNLPESAAEIKSAFKYIRREGLVMSCSIIIAKLTNDIQHNLLVRFGFKHLTSISETFYGYWKISQQADLRRRGHCWTAIL